jgi:hypothetical protein
MRWILTKHGKSRRIERFNYAIKFRSNVSKYRFRWLGKDGLTWHLYDEENGVEIIGRITRKGFIIFTMFSVSLNEFFERRTYD